MFKETTAISEFNIQRDGYINIRKTTNVTKNAEVIASSHWRCVLAPNDPQAEEVLNEPYYADLAKLAWTPEIVAAYEAKKAAEAQASLANQEAVEVK